MFADNISCPPPYGSVACLPCCLPYQFVSITNVGWTCHVFYPLTFLLCACTNIGIENVLGQLLNELMNKRPSPPLFSVTDVKARVLILPSPPQL